jgi:RIO-like serine/threonine protein kinase
MSELYGYVYEEDRDRVVGIAMESLTGEPAGPEDLADCFTVLKHMHAAGLVHGDVNRYNFMRTAFGMKIFDFEDACSSHSQPLQQQELADLAVALADEIGVGRR